jgi:hypothetical protein
MKSISKAAAGGLLWLSFSALGFGTNIYFTGQPENVENGGQFTADLNNNTADQFYTYCVDSINVAYQNTAYAVNVVNLSNSAMVVADTRYGQTAAGSFTYAVTVDNVPPASGTSAATAQERYAMAAYLIEQYVFPVNSADSNTDDEIQNAVWTLLDATGKAFSTCATLSTTACTTATDAEISAATTWINNAITAGTLTAFENTVVVYSATSIAGTADPARYSTGNQEMIGFNTPEPATLAMLGLGLVGIGLLKKRVKA